MKLFMGLLQIFALLGALAALVMLLFGATTVGVGFAWASLGLFTFNSILMLGFNHGKVDRS